MTIEQFIKKYNNQGVDVDGAFGPQCMDLMHQYIIDVFGLGRSVLQAPTAYQAYQKGDKQFTKIPYSKMAVPQYGDIVFWGAEAGPSGHVAIFIESLESGFMSFDQNYPVGSVSHMQEHDYRGVVGWLRLNTNEFTMTQYEELKKRIDSLEMLSKQDIQLLKQYIEVTDKKINQLRGGKASKSRLKKAIERLKKDQ